MNMTLREIRSKWGDISCLRPHFVETTEGDDFYIYQNMKYICDGALKTISKTVYSERQIDLLLIDCNESMDNIFECYAGQPDKYLLACNHIISFLDSLREDLEDDEHYEACSNLARFNNNFCK